MLFLASSACVRAVYATRGIAWPAGAPWRIRGVGVDVVVIADMTSSNSANSSVPATVPGFVKVQGKLGWKPGEKVCPGIIMCIVSVLSPTACML